MPRLQIKEIGRFRCGDDLDFPRIFQVTGLPSDYYCVIAVDGPDQWRIDWHEFKNRAQQMQRREPPGLWSLGKGNRRIKPAPSFATIQGYPSHTLALRPYSTPGAPSSRGQQPISENSYCWIVVVVCSGMGKYPIAPKQCGLK